ncbi:uncharacterized protein [Dendropsophus ebraccatus]|uniref:uncharacterized protein n=1 Tax=Dendropsophus ebraccatus TaxID=150705 RepID=UPI0038315233
MWVSLVVILPLLWKEYSYSHIDINSYLTAFCPTSLKKARLGITCPPGYTIQVSPSVSVQEGLCVTIPCTFTADNRNTFSNTTGYWRRIPPNTEYTVATNNKSSDVKKPNFYLTGNPDSGDCTLTITDAGREDEGVYYFRFAESKESLVRYSYYREVTTTITVTDPPITVTWEINGKKDDKTDIINVAEGSSVILRCSVLSDLTHNVTWTYRKNKILQQGTGKELEVRLENMTMAHTGTYTCSVTNKCGEISRNINITVQYRPKNMEIMISSSKDKERPASPQVTINENETMTLTCRADGNPPSTVVWVRGGDDNETSITSNSGLSAEINVTSSEADVYQCLAWNGLGLRERRIQVGIKQEKSQLQFGRLAKLLSKVHNEAEKHRWFMDNTDNPVPDVERFLHHVVRFEEPYTHYELQVHLIRDLSLTTFERASKDEQEMPSSYTLEVTKVSQPMNVDTVLVIPACSKGITCLAGYSIQVSPSVSVQEGLCVTIPCTFTADGRNTFINSYGYWRRIPPNTDYIVATNDESNKPTEKTNFYLTGNPDTGDCTLTITDARREDQGTYYFRFEESKYSKVKYGYKREMPTLIIVTDLTEEPVISDLGTVTAGIDKTVTCSPPGNCSSTSLVIQWKKSDVSGIWKNSPTITFTPSPDDHQKTITCEIITPGGKTSKKTILLDVCYVSEEPVISDLGTVTAGIDKTMTCHLPGNCSVTSIVIQWKKSDVPGIWNKSSSVTFTPSVNDHQKNITCEATNFMGKKTERTILLEVNVPLPEDSSSSRTNVPVGLITGGSIIVSTILFGIIFLVVRNKRKSNPGELSMYLHLSMS